MLFFLFFYKICNVNNLIFICCKVVFYYIFCGLEIIINLIMNLYNYGFFNVLFIFNFVKLIKYCLNG